MFALWQLALGRREYPPYALLVRPGITRESDLFQTLSPDCEPVASEVFVAPIEKSKRNPFSSMITIGRARNNDVVLPYGGVSKLHAWLTPVDASGSAEIVDVGSSYGTTVNRRSLKVRSRQALRPGDQVSFGGVRCTFVSEAALRAEVAALGSAGPTAEPEPEGDSRVQALVAWIHAEGGQQALERWQLRCVSLLALEGVVVHKVDASSRCSVECFGVLLREACEILETSTTPFGAPA